MAPYKPAFRHPIFSARWSQARRHTVRVNDLLAYCMPAIGSGNTRPSAPLLRPIEGPQLRREYLRHLMSLSVETHVVKRIFVDFEVLESVASRWTESPFGHGGK